VSSTSVETLRSCAAASPAASATRAGRILPCGLLPPLFLGSSSNKVLDSSRRAPPPLVSLAAGCVSLVGPAALVLCRVCRERKIDGSGAKKKRKMLTMVLVYCRKPSLAQAMEVFASASGMAALTATSDAPAAARAACAASSSVAPAAIAAAWASEPSAFVKSATC
jgi:hypothetical protein